MFKQAKKFLDENTYNVNSYKEFKTILKKGGFIKCGWDGTKNSEAIIKSETKATIRCILDEKPTNKSKCIYSEKLAKYIVIYAKAY